ncbi:MAG: hypothetical protein P4L34_07375 [Paludibacter sp.]|nr:hypothetical protein [Paludibacter sp.]
MKKLLSILFAGLILLSGMHLSLASHYCGGELAAVKWSLDDAKASCGMQMATIPTSNGKSFNAPSCCKDEMAFYAVDNNYNPSALQINAPVNQLLQVFYIPEAIGLHFFNTNSSVNATIQPPGKFIASAVSLPDICVFRI